MLFYKSKLVLLILMIISVLNVACTTSNERQTTINQISNEAQQDAQNNFNELKYLFKTKNYSEAYTLLDDMKSTLPYSRYTKHGKILEIHSYYQQKKFVTASNKATEFIKTHPTHQKLDYVIYLRALSSYDISEPFFQNISQLPKIIEINRIKIRHSFGYFSELAQNYPKSSYFKDAVIKIKKLRQVLAEYELNDAYLLFDASKYNDVIKRTNYLIKYYPRSTLISQALKLQVRSYRQLGQIDNAKSVEANLRRNYSQ